MKTILIAFFLIYSCQPLFSQAKLHLDKEKISKVDTIYPANYMRYITIYNVGDSDLVLSDLGSSCNCTSLSLDSYTVPANDSINLFVKLNHGSDVGNKQYHIYFASNDSLNAWNDVQLNLFVKTDLISEPEKFPAYTNIKKGSVITYKFKLNNIGNDDIKLKNPLIADNSLYKIVSFSPKNRIIHKNSEKEFQLKIKILTKDIIFSKLLIPTNSSKVPNLEYTILVTPKD